MAASAALSLSGSLLCLSLRFRLSVSPCSFARGALLLGLMFSLLAAFSAPSSIAHVIHKYCAGGPSRAYLYECHVGLLLLAQFALCARKRAEVSVRPCARPVRFRLCVVSGPMIGRLPGLVEHIMFSRHGSVLLARPIFYTVASASVTTGTPKKKRLCRKHDRTVRDALSLLLRTTRLLWTSTGSASAKRASP